MKRMMIAAVFVATLLLVVACAPKQLPTTAGETAISPEEKDIAVGVDEINNWDTLEQELEQDVSFDEVDQLLK